MPHHTSYGSASVQILLQPALNIETRSLHPPITACSVCLADSNGFLPTVAGQGAARDTSIAGIARAGIASTCDESLSAHLDSGMLLRFQDLARLASARHKQLRANLLANCNGGSI
jgi:hypothetical protein